MKAQYLLSKLASAVFVTAMAIAPSVSQAATYSFTQIAGNPSSVVDQLKMDVTPDGSSGVKFEFTNNVGMASNVAEIYFDWGNGLLQQDLGISSWGIIQSGASFLHGATPPVLPGGSAITPEFKVITAFSAKNPSPTWGLNDAADTVTFTAGLGYGKTFAEVIGALDNGSLRAGMHVQAITDINDSASFVNAVPEPETWAMLLVGITLLGMKLHRKESSQELMVLSA